MVSLSLTPQLCYTPTPRNSLSFPFTTIFRPPLRRNLQLPTTTISSPFITFSSLNQPQQEPPRTLFPGGYKRPEIKVPNLVLQLTSEDVLSDDKSILDVIDKAVSSLVGILVLTGGGASGAGKLYEAARLLKSIIGDRAYLLIDERVDIAAAINASGVLLSDQGLPAIVARNTMSSSKSDSVILPLVARTVQTSNAALNASDSEGADFLIYKITNNTQPKELATSVLKDVKIPIFVTFDLLENEWFDKASDLLKSGASGLVLTLKEFKSFGDDKLHKLLYNIDSRNEKTIEKPKLQISDGINGSIGKNMAGFTQLDERKREFIETERSILLEAIDAIKRAAPLVKF